VSRQLEEESKKKQEALSTALDRLNAGETERQETKDLAELLETACWVRQNVEPPPQLLQETLDRLEAQALLPESTVSEKSGLTTSKRRNWLYAGALGVAASVLLALQLLPSSPLPVAPEEEPRLAMRSETAPIVQKEESSKTVVKEIKEESARLALPPILAAAAEVVAEADYKNEEAAVARLGQRQGAAGRNELAAAAKTEKTAELYMLRTVQLAEEETMPLVLPGEAADLVWHDRQKTIWRHVYRRDTPQEVAVTQWRRTEQFQEKTALQRAAAVLGVNRLVLVREGRVLVLEGRGGEAELRKVAEALAPLEMER
jgi:hypothetical protein